MRFYDTAERLFSRRRGFRPEYGIGLLSALGLGVGIGFLVEPDNGRRRRALVGQKFTSAFRRTGSVIDKAARDAGHRTHGLAAGTKSRLRRGEVSDAVLVERVRSKLGRLVSHPHAIDVMAQNGAITLRGPILRDELKELLSGIIKVKGVADVRNQLDVHEEAGGTPSLQGGRRRRGPRSELVQATWTPALRVVMGLLGSGLIASGVARRDRVGAALGTAGGLVLLRNIGNRPLPRLLGFGGRRGFDFQKTITIDAPIERVFRFWTNFENFPRFMAHVVKVEPRGEGRWYWSMMGPAGVPVGWEAELSAYEPHRLIAWKSSKGELIKNAGVIRFEPMPDGRTRVDVKLTYNPPAGAVGHGLATLFRADPKTALDDDLLRLKSLLEEGKATARGSEARASELPLKNLS